MEETVVDPKSRTPSLASAESISNHHHNSNNKSPAPAPATGPELPHHPATTSPSASTSENAKEAAAQPPATEAPAPLQTDQSPARAFASVPRESNGDSAADAPKLLNKNIFDDNEAESELSEPDSNVHSPSAVELEDEIIVGAKTNGARKASPLRVISDNEDETMADVQDGPVVSHYPKRKRTSVFADLSESKMELPSSAEAAKSKSPAPGPIIKQKPPRQSLGSVKGVLLGQWRDSPIPDKENRHAVIGFIDVRDRLRTRIQPYTVAGDTISNEYPMPPGPGGSWVTFERVVFSKHLVGLDHFQIKEYVRLRSDIHEDSQEERKAAEKAAVKDAIRRVKENPSFDNPVTQPAIAHGLDLPEASPGRPDTKRRRVSGGFASINSVANTDNAPEPSPLPQSQPPLQPRPAGTPSMHGPLPGTRPTRILLGFWNRSSEPEVKDRHAVYGILGQNDMFRVKVVRETRDGRFVDGNFPSGAGALWIPYEEVEFESHLKPLSRSEIKEYCRVRQYQLDRGEMTSERISNETKAVYEAQTRAGTGYKQAQQQQQQQQQQQNLAPSYLPIAPEEAAEVPEQTNGRVEPGAPEPRQSRRSDIRATPRQSLQESDLRAASRVYNDPEPPRSEPRSASRVQNSEPLERATALAQREIARVEAAQGRADRHALNRERAAAIAADAAAAAAAAATADAAATVTAPAPMTNGKPRFHESEDMQRLNKVWARQESLRLKAGTEDAKMYDGVKYERKATGPFMGKLVSQGTIINIDGEDYVEYRVLTKPSFF